MKQSKLQMILPALAVFGLLFFVAAPVALAQSASGNGNSPANRVASATESDDVADLSNVNTTHVQERIKDAQAQAKLNLAQRRAGREAKTAEHRQQVCENRKTSINNKIQAFNKSGENILTRFDAVYTRVKAFKTDKQLDVTNYDDLVATADAKQQAATEAVAALKDLTADFDCTSTDPAQSVAAIKTATSDAKAALKDYRTSIKNIVVALAQVNKSSDGSSDTGSTNSPTTTTPETTTNTTTEAQ